jgi:hypothetical protein
MRTRSLALAAAVLLATAGCGAEEEETPEAVAPEASVPATEDATTPPAAGGDATPTATDGAAEGEMLMGTVGEADNPDAFTITLTDGSGQPVDALPPGDYTIQVSDLSQIHNFHLTGPGVEETTTVPETGDAIWDVTLEAGTYTFVCDPHPNMSGQLTVA